MVFSPWTNVILITWLTHFCSISWIRISDSVLYPTVSNVLLSKFFYTLYSYISIYIHIYSLQGVHQPKYFIFMGLCTLVTIAKMKKNMKKTQFVANANSLWMIFSIFDFETINFLMTIFCNVLIMKNFNIRSFNLKMFNFVSKNVPNSFNRFTVRTKQNKVLQCIQLSYCDKKKKNQTDFPEIQVTKLKFLKNIYFFNCIFFKRSLFSPFLGKKNTVDSLNYKMYIIIFIFTTRILDIMRKIVVSLWRAYST